MLNRLYIVIGVLAIVLLAAAYVVPHFITWSDYRPRMEAMAAEALGTDVTIRGNIDFTLLPEPKLHLEDVAVGPKDDPFVTIAGVNAQFSLMDFLRDRYVVNQLVVDRPTIHARIDEDGQLHLPLHLPETVSTSNVSIADARLAGGTVTLADARSGRTFEATGISGDLQLTDLRGPYALQGMGAFEGRPYSVRVSSTTLGPDGSTKLSVFLRPSDGAFSVSLDGELKTGPSPDFSGDLTYRRAAPGGEDATRGDLVLEGKMQASPDKAVLSSYTLQPDENRAGMRLTGSATVALGAKPRFDASVSGGVIALGTPGAADNQDTGPGPYGIVKVLEGLPVPLVPPIPGKIGIDIAELDLGAAGLRDVSADADADANGWTLSHFDAKLPGETGLALKGRLGQDNGNPSFAGTVSLKTERLDSLALSWRKPAPDNPLFDMPGSYSAKVTLGGQALSLSDGTFTLDGVPHGVSAKLGFGSTPRLDVTARLGALSAPDSDALLALLPVISPTGAFGATFPAGSLDVQADDAVLFGIKGSGLAAQAKWGEGRLNVSRLQADDFGGIRFDLSGGAGGTLVKPVLSGKGSVSIAARAADGALAKVFDRLGVPDPVRARLVASLPADLDVNLASPDDTGAQSLAVSGKAGAAEIHANANLAQGILHAADAPITVVATATADDPAAMTAQLGLHTVSLTPQGQPMNLSLSADGTASNSLDARVSVSGGGDRMRFAGNLIVSDPAQIRGKGKLDFTLSDLGAVADLAGASGLYAPAVSGSADTSFVGADSISLSQLEAKAGDASASGALTYSRQGQGATVSGQIKVSALDTATLTALLGGPAALIPGGGLWPDGPLSAGDAPRASSGRISVTVPRIAVGDEARVADASFDYVWDDKAVNLRGFTGRIGGGTVSGDISLCCAGSTPAKRASGRFRLDNVALDAVLPQAAAAAISAKLSGSGQFNGTGDSIAKVLASLNGQGSISLSDLSIAHFDPKVFPAVAGLDNIVDLKADQLRKIVVDALDKGAFSAPKMSGVFSIAGGMLRASNLAAEGETARLFGGGSVRLSDLALEGTWNMSPTDAVAGNGLIDTTSRVGADLAGSVSAPERKLNLVSMVDSVKMKAYELEVQRLEKLKAEQDARAKAAARERARKAEEAAAAARKAAEEAAAKAAAGQGTQDMQQNGTGLPQNPTAAPPADSAPVVLPPPTDSRTAPATPNAQDTAPPADQVAPVPPVQPLTPPADVPQPDTTSQPIDLMGGGMTVLPPPDQGAPSSSVLDLTGGDTASP